LKLSGSGREGVVGLCPSVCARIVSLGGVKINAVVTTTPDDHFAAGPHGRVTALAAGALVLVPAQLSSAQGGGGGTQYLPPVFNALLSSAPPQTIISLPVHTAVEMARLVGAPVVLMAVQLSVMGLYLPPVFK